MDKQIVQALNSLLPTLTGLLPPELLELAASLLAQSRRKASSLKADEEIARSYVCSNIACERLKQNLALPEIEPRPPCPPKVYQKLYKYLDGALPSGIKKADRSFKDPVARTSNPAKHVRPDKPAQPINSRRRTAGKAIAKSTVPLWVMPVIRHLCKSLDAPAAPHHIFAGVSSILGSDSRPVDTNIPALIITICILTSNTLAGDETEPAEYLRRREAALIAVQEALAQRSVEVECCQADVDECMRQVNQYAWTDMDWFENMEGGPSLNGKENGEQFSGGDDAGDQEGDSLRVQSQGLVNLSSEEESYLQAGLGTMMDNRVDYLSDAKRRSYERWKAETLLEIEALEAEDEEMYGEEG